jgi:hypothetical protein
MSMHKIPLTNLELSGLRAHGFEEDSPSQLSDAFRLGVKWALEHADNECCKKEGKLTHSYGCTKGRDKPSNAANSGE